MADLTLSWLDDLHQVKGSVLQLQSTLNQLLGRTPTVRQFKELKSLYDNPSASDTAATHHLLEKLKLSLNSPQLKVAVRLKSLFDKGYLQFLTGLTRINFKHPRADRFVGYLLDYTPEKPSLEVAGGADKHDGSSQPPHEKLLAYPPALPPIENALLLRLVLTDKSLRQPSDFLELGELEDFNNNHNRKLSLLGESLLSLALAELLDEQFPKYHEDDLRYLKSRLMATQTLAKIAYSYNLADVLLALIPKDASVDEKLTVFKNVFLAYLAGMSKADYSFGEIKAWVVKLYLPMIEKLKEQCQETSCLKSPYAVAYLEFQFLVMRINNLSDTETKKIKYSFKTLLPNEEMEVHSVQLVLHDTELGIGTSSDLAEAKQKAVYALFEEPTLKRQLLEVFFAHYRTPRFPPAVLSLQQYCGLNHERAPEKPQAERKDMGMLYSDRAPEKKQDDDSYSPNASDMEYEPVDVKNDVKPEVKPESKPKPERKEEKKEEPEVAQPRKPLPYGMLPAIPKRPKK